MKANEIIAEVDNLEKEIASLWKEYFLAVEPCGNKKCSFYSEKNTGYCNWTNRITECRDYFPDRSGDEQ